VRGGANARGPRRAGRARRPGPSAPIARRPAPGPFLSLAFAGALALSAGSAPAQTPTEATAGPSVDEAAIASVDRALMDRRLIEVYGPDVPVETADRLAVDLTCDGATDQVAGFHDPDGPGGPTYAVAIATTDTPDGAVALIPFDLPLDAARQTALCPVDDPADIRLEVEKWSPADQRNVLGLKLACPCAIVVVDGQCDSPRLFWNGFEGEGPPVIFFRN